MRWERGDRSGYMPAYKVDWEGYNAHKAAGGNFASYANKEYLALDDTAINNHLNGDKTIGLYPLLTDNTSYFIVADFDEANWAESIVKLHNVCKVYNIPAYIERSRSGNGGHLWIFFEENIPAFQSRAIMFSLLLQSEILSRFDKEPSFDRLFPNQDEHSGKGLGNLIALPLQGKSLTNGNSCFIDPVSFEAIANQWQYLSEIKRVSKTTLEMLYLQLTGKSILVEPILSVGDGKGIELEILIRGEIYLRKAEVNKKLTEFLRDNLNFLNSDYFVRQNMGRTAHSIEKYFKLIKESDEGVIIPRGFASKLIGFCRTEQIPININDQRCKQEEVKISSKATLRSNQQEAIEATEKRDFGVIYSPPSSGKTFIGLELIVQKRQPTLILVHRKQLLDQWIDRIQSVLGVPKRDIGLIGGGKEKIGKVVTIAMIQSLVRYDSLSHISDKFGMIIVDECHHIPAKSFRNVITQFNSYYLYGLTATPYRKNNDEKLIYVYIGNIIYELSQSDYLKAQQQRIEINIKETQLTFPYDNKIDEYEQLSKVAIYDTRRNEQIIGDIKANIDRFKMILVLTERKAHVDILNQYLKSDFETITISGDDSERSRKSKLEQIAQGHCKVVISTGQFFGEGIDVSNLECLFIVYPFAFEAKLVQYIGRIQRSKQPPVIFDYRDTKIDYFEKMFKKRNRYYNKLRKIDYDEELFSEDVAVAESENNTATEVATTQNSVDVVLQTIITNEGITAKQIAEYTSLSLVEVRKEIKRLKDRVEFRGAKKSGGYFCIS
ncbi:MAG: DEAD/DEAH box helicase family protein [Rikenellaceae bacterium]